MTTYTFEQFEEAFPLEAADFCEMLPDQITKEILDKFAQHLNSADGFYIKHQKFIIIKYDIGKRYVSYDIYYGRKFKEGAERTVENMLIAFQIEMIYIYEDIQEYKLAQMRAAPGCFNAVPENN